LHHRRARPRVVGGRPGVGIAFAEAGADLVTALTLTGTGEAIGIVGAARAAGLPVAISFTVELDGRLPDGTPLSTAVIYVDAEGGPDYFMVNCAHPSHIAPGLTDEGDWRLRIRGLRANASTRSHAELDPRDRQDRHRRETIGVLGDRLVRSIHERVRRHALLVHVGGRERLEERRRTATRLSRPRTGPVAPAEDATNGEPRQVPGELTDLRRAIGVGARQRSRRGGRQPPTRRGATSHAATCRRPTPA
jgi:hypothetical protein